MNWYLEVLKKYAVFEGRARRKEYWFFILFNVIISMALAVIDRLTGNVDPDTGVGILSGIYALGVMIPGMAVSVRRLYSFILWCLIATRKQMNMGHSKGGITECGMLA
jgi:uncharacterized membrane protein YhaH (DUF805 family)